MAKGKKDKVPAPGKFPKTKKVEKECKGKWANWLKTKTTIDYLPGKMIEWDGTMVLAKALEKNQTVMNMDFSHNLMKDDGLKFLAQTFKINACMRNINLSCNAIGDGGGLALASALMTNRTLTAINLLGNELTCITAQAFGNVLKVNTELTQLNLTWNKIGHRGARALAASMEYNRLAVVEMGGQQSLGDESVQYLCDALKAHGQKDVHTHIALWHNDIGKRGANAIASLLCDNEIVQDLNISWNSIGSEGLESLSQSLISGKSFLRSVNVAHNIVGDCGAKEFAKVLEMSIPTLEKVNISNNTIGCVGAAALAAAVAKNTTLKHLDMSCNQVADEGAAAFVTMIRENKHLMTLQLQKNLFTDALKTSLSEAMRASESTTRDARSAVPAQIRVNYGAADDDNALAEIFGKGDGKAK